MERMEIVEERVAFDGNGLTLSGVMAYPATGAPRRAALLCPPHPHFAGDMENNVVLALARHMATDSVVLRFDYRGVGESQIKLPPGVSVFDYWDDVEEKKDYAGALSDVWAAGEELSRAARGLPLVVVGYSFGAVTGLMFGRDCAAVRAMAGISPPLKKVSFDFLADCPKPCLLLSGKNDFVCSAEEMAWAKKLAGRRLTTALLGGDHFFRQEENILCARVDRFVRKAVPLLRCTPRAPRRLEDVHHAS